MKTLTYKGPLPAVSVEGKIVKRGEQVDLEDAVAEELAQRKESWTTAAPKRREEETRK